MTEGLKKSVIYGGIAFLLCTAYLVTAIIGLRFDAVSGFATLVWPPTGIALAAMFLLGSRYWPAIAVAAFAANYIIGAPVIVALGIAFGNTGEALLGAHLLKRADFHPKIDRVKDALALIFMASLFSTLVSPTVGVASLLSGGVIAASAIAKTWIAWWIGDVLGALVFGSLLFVVFSMDRPKIDTKKVGEVSLLCFFLVLAGILSFGNPFGIWSRNPPLCYLVYVPLLWAALRFGQVGTILATFVTAAIAVWGTIRGDGAFARGGISESLIYLQLFMGVIAASALIVAAEETERRSAEKDMREFNKVLEENVRQRTMLCAYTNKELEQSKGSLEKRRAVLQAVIQSIVEGVVAIDKAGDPIVVNAAAINMLGLTQSDVSAPIGRLAKRFPAYYADGKTPVKFENLPMTCALRGETTVNQRLVFKPRGRQKGINVLVSGSPVKNEKGAVVGGVVIFREAPEK
ncbi:MAG: MASE1 domain-containing protein [Patescibacteria group bacterium]